MDRFEYSGQCQNGTAISGILESEDTVHAVEQLTAMRLQNIEVRKTEMPPPRRPLGNDDFIFFNEQLASLANAGMCLDAGLRQMGRDVHSTRLQRVMESMADELEKGSSLPEAIEKHAPQLPPLYGRIIRAGLHNGNLSATLINLSHHLKLIGETRRLLFEALTYPAIVFLLAAGVFCSVLVFIVPQFVDIFDDFGVRLPMLTHYLIVLAHAMPKILVTLAALTMTAVALFFGLRRSSAGLQFRERIVLGIPLLGSIIRNSLRARFLRAMAFAVHSGMTLPEALRLSAGATGSPGLSLDAELVAEGVDRGCGLEEASRRAKFIPAMLAYFVGVGGDAANLRDGLIQMAKACESQATHSQAMLRGWAAPVAILWVGSGVAVLILALFLPLLQLISMVSG